MGIIYKIEVGEMIYYGSTIQKLLSMRQSRHNFNLRSCPNQYIYKECIANNIDKIICVFVEMCENSKIKERENFYIQNCINSMNMRYSLLTKEKKDKTRKKYYSSEKGKISKRNCDKRYHQKKIQSLRTLFENEY